MKNSRFLTDYGMLLVLALLCAFFSVVTYSDQSPVGEAAAKQVVSTIRGQFGTAPRVLIVASDQPNDALFTSVIERNLTGFGGTILATVKGEPRDAREALIDSSRPVKSPTPSPARKSPPRGSSSRI